MQASDQGTCTTKAAAPDAPPARANAGLAPTQVLTEKPGAGTGATATDVSWRRAAGLEDYEFIEEIGRGGMGVVYRARQKSLDRLVAVKMILTSRLDSADRFRLFTSEARTAASLIHPNIVKVLAAGERHGQPFFAMEYIAGTDLGAVVRRDGPRSPEEAARLMSLVARAVAHLHEHGIVHRDLKPANILLDAAGQPYVTDFGLAAAFAGEGVTPAGVIAGTPSYMSPEQARGGSATVGPASDVFSLGAILYELLTGAPPFRRETTLLTLEDVLVKEPPLPRSVNPAVPRELEWICLRCLRKAPARRYPSAAALAEDLEQILRGEPVATQAPRPHERMAHWARRAPALAMRLLAIGLFYALALVNCLVCHAVDSAWLLHLTGVLGLWVAASVGLQQWLERPGRAQTAMFVWGAVDVVALSWIVWLTDGAASRLVVVFPLVIAASGLWFQPAYVRFVTGLCLAAYVGLIADAHLFRPAEWQQRFGLRWDRHSDCLLALLLTGVVVSYLVRRVRALSRYLRKCRA